MDLITLIFTLVPIAASNDDSSAAAAAPLLLLLSGFVFYFYIYSRYRNADKRHSHERETSAHVENLAVSDVLLKNQKGLTNAKMRGANQTRVEGALNTGDKSPAGLDYAKRLLE